MVGLFRIPPFLYQLIPKWGTEGGLIEKPPEIETCGSFSFGRLHEKLNLLFNAPIAFDTAFFADSIFPLIADTIFPKILVTVFFAADKPEEKAERIPDNADDTFAFAVLILLLIVARTFSNAELVADDTANQAAEAVDRMDEVTKETVAFAALILFEI